MVARRTPPTPSRPRRAAPRSAPQSPPTATAGAAAARAAAVTAGLDPTTAGREALADALAGARYFADPPLVTALFLALRLGRPLFVEGPAGVGKTELARVAATVLGRELVRLQCYEGLDEARALYDWDYAKQMLYTQLLRDALARETRSASSVAQAADVVAKSEATFFDRRFLVARPLLAALEAKTPTVLLIDEVDRADPEFEAFLLELLADYQVTIPELGTVRARHEPLCILTTNGTREMTEALRRRCVHAFVDYPAPERELAIIRARVPEIEARLAEALVTYLARVRKLDLKKSPSVGEALDWARALVTLNASTLDADVVRETMSVVLKHQEDAGEVEARLGELLRA